ncbi:polyribonucleotide nucleotidyltransferase, partial [Rhodoferax sp. 4810]|nr:polyribonucleotide nucleotidyltransferase [Rhodoferax jenense]
HVETPQVDEELLTKVREVAAAGMEKVFNTSDKLERGHVYDVLKEEVLAAIDPDGEMSGKVKDLLSAYKKSFMREKIVNSEIRIGGRKFNEVRSISCETEYLPRTHGSALFTRGETQALVTTTLGSERDKQRVETLQGEQLNRFMLHYNFPPYCVG